MSDLIRRTDAIKAIEDLPNAYNGWSDAYDKAYVIGTLEDVPTVEPIEWIPCSERLPSSSGKYWVTEGAEQRTTSVGYYSAEHKRFYSAMDVIAWMPLPLAYQGE